MNEEKKDRGQNSAASQGGYSPVVDPTKNVLDLFEAGSTRQDDLRKEHKKFVAMQIRHVKQLIGLNAQHAKEMAAKESDRLDKIRQVDVLNASSKAAEALTAIQTLANTTTANADNIKNAVAEAAASIAASTANTVTEINKRLAALEKASYEGVGKQTLADPQMANLIKVVGELAAKGEQGTGKTSGFNTSWAVLLGAVTLIVGLVFIASVIVAIAFAIRQ